jgi:tetratricopeptide (TPR) repeat protein
MLAIKEKINFTLLAKWLLWLGFLGAVLVFAPPLLDRLGLPKQLWLMVFLGLAGLAWLWNSFISQKLAFKKDLASLFLGLWLLLLVLGTVLAESPWKSFWGESGTLPGLFNFILLGALGFYLVSNLAGFSIGRLFYWGVVGVGAILMLVTLFSLLAPQLLGIPADFAAALMPFGSHQAALVWLGFVLILLGANAVLRIFPAPVWVWVLKGIIGLGILVIAFLISLKAFWLALALSFLALLLFLIRGEQSQSRSILVVTLIVLVGFSLAFWGDILNARLGINQVASVPAQILPSHSASWGVASQAISSRPLLGTGLSTFGDQYLKFRSPSLNQTPFWPIKFNQASSSFLTALTETGYLGVGLFAAFLVAAFLQGWLAKGKRFFWALGGVYFGILWFLYPMTLTHFSFLFLAVALVVRGNPAQVLDLSKLRPQLRNFYYVGILILTLVILAGIYGSSVRFAGNYLLQQGRNLPEFNQKISFFARAASLDNFSALNWRLLSEVNRQQLALVLQAASQAASQEELSKLRPDLFGNQALIAAQKAIKLDPLSAVSWQQLALVYETLIPLSPDAANQALLALNEVRRRHPASPATPIDITRVLLKQSERLKVQAAALQSSSDEAAQGQIQQLNETRQAFLDEALAQISQSLQLKPDYAPAHFLLVQVRDTRGELEEAIAQAARIVQAAPQDFGTWFQLGFLQFKAGDSAAAANSFEKAVELKDDFGNARYLLGLVYSNLGRPQAALGQFRKIAQLDPDNQEVARIIDNLENGRVILEGIVPPAQAPDERPEPPIQQSSQQSLTP